MTIIPEKRVKPSVKDIISHIEWKEKPRHINPCDINRECLSGWSRYPVLNRGLASFVVPKTDFGREIKWLLQVHLASSGGTISMGSWHQCVTTSAIKAEVETQRTRIVPYMKMKGNKRCQIECNQRHVSGAQILNTDTQFTHPKMKYNYQVWKSIFV